MKKENRGSKEKDRKEIRSDQGYKLCEYVIDQGCLEFKHGRVVDTIKIDRLCEQVGLYNKD